MKTDIVVIGSGIVGLATALKIKLRRPDLNLLVLDKELEVAAHQTGHNSGVIHSGLYYKPGSMKALNCINGYQQLLKFALIENIPHEICGKIVVATGEAELTALENLYTRGNQNGLKGIKKLNQPQLKEIEPHVNGIAGIFVPQTGIIDFKQVSAKYAEKILGMGGHINLGEKVLDIKHNHQTSQVITSKSSYETKLIVNCGGLYSDKLAQLTHPNLNVKIIPFRGEYYKLKPSKKHLVKNLIYPVPDPAFPFLGVHFTRMIDGAVEAGPNAVLAFAREGYSKSIIHPAELIEILGWPGFQKVASKYWRTGLGEMYRSFSKKAFTKALQKLMPDIREEDLEPGGAGVRAQACDKKGGLIDDFLILETEQAVNVCNAPSPAATSSLAIGDTVAEKVLARF
ncbi:MAG: L-2-hydroxyglutarate oxidase [Candidatus Cyclobacteriaceae bacterium M3_2C_046]